MKQLFKSFLLSIVLISLTNCEKDDSIGDIKTQRKNIFPYTLKTKTFKELNQTEKFSKVLNDFSKMHYKYSNYNAKSAIEEEYGFTIDSSKINEISSEDFTTYTFYIYKDSIISETYYENLVLKVDSNNITRAFIIKYVLNPDGEYIAEHEAKSKDDIVEIKEIDYVNNELKVSAECVGILMCPWSPDGSGEPHPAGQACIDADRGDLYLDTSICNDSSGSGNNNAGGNDGSNTSGNGTNNNTGSNNTGNGTNSDCSTCGAGGSPGSGGSDPVVTTPVLTQGEILSFHLSNLLNLSDPQVIRWIETKYNWNKAQAVYDFLENNDCGSVISSSTSTTDCTQINTIANEVLNTMIANGELTPLEAFEQFFSENLDLIVVDGPDIAIDDMEEYLDCFDTSAGAANAIITLSVDEPIENSTAVYSTIDGVGHTFITIEQGDNVASFGFYPLNSLPSLFTPVTGVMGDNSNTEFDVSLTIKNVSPSDLQLVIDHAINYANLEYDLHWNNCTDMGISITNLIGLSIPECNANPLIFFGTTPGRLGEYIRNLSSPLPNNVEKNESGGNSPNNNCN